MAIALAGIAALLGLVLLVLAVPIAAEFRLQRTDAIQGWVKLRWLFGLVRLQVNWPGLARPAAAATRRRERAGKARAARGDRGQQARALRLFRDSAFRQRVFRLAKDLVEAAHLRPWSLHARLGLGDPADTGRLWALIGPLNAAAQGLAGADLQIEPEFVDPVFEFDARGRCLLVPLQFLALAVTFVFSPAAIRAWRTMRSTDG